MRVARAVEALLVLTVTGSVLALGSVHMIELLVVSALAFAGGALAMSGFSRPPLPAVVLAGLGLFSLLQAVPLPEGLVGILSPATAEIWRHCLDPIREPALTYFPLSLDGGASIAEGLKWLTYAAVYVMAARVRIQRSSTWLAALLFVSAALVAMATIWHGVENEPQVYGFYQPNFAVGRWNVGPLLNSNNFGGYVNLGLFAGIGILLSSKPNISRAPIVFCLAVMVTALLLSGSRGAILSALAGGFFVVIRLALDRRVSVSRARLVKGVAPLLVATASFFVLSGTKEWQVFGASDVERKVGVWRWSLPMIRDHFWFGVGRGAFETAFPPYRVNLRTDWTAVFAYAENFVVQWLAEWGVPVGLIALVAVLGYVGTQWYAARNERLRFLVFTGVGVLLLQNLVDLGLEIPSVAIALVVAIATGERRLQSDRAQTEGRRGATIRASLVAAALACLWLLAIAKSRSPVEEERRSASVRYSALVSPGVAEFAAFRLQMRDAILRHPGEPHFPLLGALLAYRTRAESPLPWIARALELGPTNGRVHLALAELLHFRRATLQSILHLRLAAEYDETLAGIVGTRIAQWVSSLDELKQGIPVGQNGRVVLTAACAELTSLQLKIDCFRYDMEKNPRDAAIPKYLAEELLVAMRSKSAPCALAQDCQAEVDLAARAIQRLNPGSWQAGYILAKKLELQGDFKGAASILSSACPSGKEGQQCSRESVEVAIKSGQDSDISSAADAYSARECAGDAACAAALDWLSGTLDASGKGALSVKYLTKSAELEASADRWLQVAKRADKLQLAGLALAALDHADRSPDSTSVTRAITSRLRGEIARRSPLGL